MRIAVERGELFQRNVMLLGALDGGVLQALAEISADSTDGDEQKNNVQLHGDDDGGSGE